LSSRDSNSVEEKFFITCAFEQTIYTRFSLLLPPLLVRFEVSAAIEAEREERERERESLCV